MVVDNVVHKDKANSDPDEAKFSSESPFEQRRDHSQICLEM